MEKLQSDRTKFLLGFMGTGLVACAALFYISRRKETKKAPVVTSTPPTPEELWGFQAAPTLDARSLSTPSAPERKFEAEEAPSLDTRSRSTPVAPVRKQAVQASPTAPTQPTPAACSPLLECENGILTKESLIKVLETIRMKVTDNYKEMNYRYIAARRAVSGNEAEYTKIVKEWKTNLESLNDVTCAEIFAFYQVSESDFSKAVQLFIKDPEIFKLLQSIGIDFDIIQQQTEVPESLTLTKFEEISKTAAEIPEGLLENLGVKSEFEYEMFKALLQDEIYKRLGYENWVVQAAAKKYSSSESSQEYTRRINTMFEQLVAFRSAKSKDFI